MKNAVLLGATLLLCGALAIAQETPQSGSSTSETPSTAPSSNEANTPSNDNTIQGCLTGSSGNYMLTDTTGMVYQLTGDESQLSANVNKQVEVTGTAGAGGAAAESHTPPDANASGNSAEAQGTTGNAGAAGSASASAGAGASKILAVTSITKVADSCSPSK